MADRGTHGLRLATANILHGIDIATGRVDLDAVASALAALDADVLALQEVDRDLARSGNRDQARELGERLGMHARFAPALLGDPDDRWTTVGADVDGRPGYGVALLSRTPLRDVIRTALPGGGPGRRAPRAETAQGPRSPGWDREPRTALTATADVRGTPLRVTTTHASYLPWRAALQLRATEAVARGEGEPAVLAGDCNLPVGAVRALLGRAWTHAGGAPTYPSWQPRMQVDQIAATGGVAVEDVAVLDVPTSDHRAVLARLRVPATG